MNMKVDILLVAINVFRFRLFMRSHILLTKENSSSSKLKRSEIKIETDKPNKCVCYFLLRFNVHSVNDRP